jgi:hypothetical protein
MLRRDEELPAIPSYKDHDVAKWEKKGHPIPPGGEMVRYALQIIENPTLLYTEELVLWVHGYIKYHDVFSRKERETRYCYRWEPGRVDAGMMQFSIDGPPAYNQVT